MEQKDNIKYVLLDVWETLLFSNKNEKKRKGENNEYQKNEKRRI